MYILGHGGMLQFSVIRAVPSHFFPPSASCLTIVLSDVFVPPLQVFEQGDQSPYDDHRQSTMALN